MSLTCPKCQQTIHVKGELPPKELLCSSCGTQFVEATTETVTLIKDIGNETVTYVPANSTGSLTHTAESDSRRFGDYELLEEIARGGMGVVYKAQQNSLNRIVALKMIKSGELAGDEEIQRFRTEAEAAAQLDHPNIVPIYEVGERHGRHFFSMGFVDGEGLDACLKNGPLQPRESAELIATIAEAIQFAHEKGIVHRDLKPANVLLDADGKPRITDFGLAKNIAFDCGMTATGQVMGTPSYMPPEQAAGNTEAIGLTADVYSLGAMLYALLTGRPPFQAANIMETLKQVLEREPISPRDLNSAVDRDLETICLKCLEKSPARRYATASAVAEELERFLAGKPIAARPVGSLQKSWRWCRRNRWATLAIAMGAILAIGGPMAAFWQQQLYSEAEFQRGRADGKVVELQNALDEKIVQERRATHNLEHAVAVVDSFLTKIGREGGVLSRYPNTQPIRRELLEQARDYYETFVKENRSAELNPMLASAMFRLANIQAMLGEHDKALRDFQNTLAIEEELLAADPNNPVRRNSVASVLNNIGIELTTLGKPNEALDAYRRGLALRTALAIEFPDESEYRVGIARLHNGIGNSHSDAGVSGKALESYGKARDLWKQLLVYHAETPLYRAELARASYNIALQKGRQGSQAEALDDYRHALALRDGLAVEFPQDPEYQDDLAAVLHNISLAYDSLKQYKLAESSLQRALQIRTKLAQDHPSVPDYRNGLAKLQHTLAQLRNSMGNHAEALGALDAAILRRKSLLKSNRATLDHRESLAKSLTMKADVLRKLGRRTEAEAVLREAVTIREQLANASPNAFTHAYGLAKAHWSLGEFHGESDRWPDALTQYRAAIKIVEGLAKADPSNDDLVDSLAALHRSAGVSYRRLRRFKEAADEFRIAFNFWTRLTREHPNVESHVDGLANLHESRGHLYRDTGRPEDALREYERGLDIYRRLDKKSPARAERQVATALLRSAIARLHEDCGQLDVAINQQRAVLATWTELNKKYPEVLRYRDDMARASGNLAISYRSAGKLELAKTHYDTSVELYQRLARQYPASRDYQFSLANAYNNLADLQLETRQPKRALATWRKAEVIQRKAARTFGADPAFRYALTLTLRNIGSELGRMGQFSESLKVLGDAKEYSQQLSKRNPMVAKYLDRLAECHAETAEVYYAQRKMKQATESYEQSLAIQNDLVKRYPQQATFAYGLSTSLNNFGRMLESAGRVEDARKMYTQALALREELLKKYSDSNRYRLGLARSFLKLGVLLRESDQPKALGYCQRAVTEFTHLRKKVPQNSLVRRLLRDAHWGRGKIFNAQKKYREAELEWRAAVKLAHPRFRFSDSIHLAYSLAKNGNGAEAMPIALSLKQGAERGDSCFRLAKLFAVCASLAVKGEGGSRVDSQKYAADSVELLQKAHRAGYLSDRAIQQQLQIDSDFDVLRHRQDFQKVVAQLGVPISKPARAKKPHTALETTE